jgi:hypothetical protein
MQHYTWDSRLTIADNVGRMNDLANSSGSKLATEFNGISYISDGSIETGAEIIAGIGHQVGSSYAQASSYKNFSNKTAGLIMEGFRNCASALLQSIRAGRGPTVADEVEVRVSQLMAGSSPSPEMMQKTMIVLLNETAHLAKRSRVPIPSDTIEQDERQHFSTRNTPLIRNL